MKDTTDRLLAKLEETCVFIVGTEGYGTGYLIAPNRVATAWHVVKTGEEFNITIGVGGPVCKARLINFDPNTDAAILAFDEKVEISPLPIGLGLTREVIWNCFGFPMLGRGEDRVTGLPIDGVVKHPNIKNDIGQDSIVLFSNSAAAGNASPLHGFSGSPVVVDGALVGHLTKHIGDPDDRLRPAFGLIYACPIEAVVSLLDPEIKPTKVRIHPAELENHADSTPTLGIYYSITLRDLYVPENNGEPDTTIPALSLSAVLPIKILMLTLEPNKLTIERFDEALSGEEWRAEVLKYNEFERSNERNLASIRATLSRIQSEQTNIQTSIRQIESQRRPPQPIKPQQPQNDGSFASLDYEMQVRVAKQYTEALSKYENAVKRHEQEKIDFERRKLELPGHRDRISQLQHQADQAKFEIGRAIQAFAEQKVQFAHNIDLARARDIIQLLINLRDSKVDGFNDARGALPSFLRVLVAHLLFSLSQPWLHSSFGAASQIAQDVVRSAEEMVRVAHSHIGLDVLRRCMLLMQALRCNEKQLKFMHSALGALPSDRLSRVNIDFLNIINQCNFDSVPEYSHIETPSEFDTVSAALTITHNQILAVQKQQKFLLDQTADLFDSVIAARTQASSHQSFIQELVNRVNPHFQEIQIIWQVFTAAQRVHGLTEATLAYITVLREECGRRFEGPIDELISRCEQSDLLLGEANRYLSEHPTATFLAHRETLVRDVTRIERLGGEYSIALEDIKGLPDRVFDKYVKRMRLYLLGAIFPLFNILCVGLLVRDVERLRTALASSLPSFVSLRRQFEKACILLACMSVLCAGLLLFQGEHFEWMGTKLFGTINPTLIKWVGVYCYLVSLAMSLWSLSKLRPLSS